MHGDRITFHRIDVQPVAEHRRKIAAGGAGADDDAIRLNALMGQIAERCAARIFDAIDTAPRDPRYGSIKNEADTAPLARPGEAAGEFVNVAGGVRGGEKPAEEIAMQGRLDR